MSEKITIIGAGVSGRALALYAARRGADVFVTDSKAELPEETHAAFDAADISWECGAHTLLCCESDLVVVSSGVPESSSAVAMAREKNIPVLGELDYLAPDLHGKLIAITGTNGKTTCTALTAHILRENGVDAVACGNIGEPLAAHAGKGYGALVMELSSFQLHWNTRLAPDVAVLTNLAPDHIDWHGSYENYIADKCRIFLPAQSGGYAVVHEADAPRVPKERQTVSLGQGDFRLDISGEKVCLRQGELKRLLFRKSALPLIGTHNLENAAMSAAAAVLACPGIDTEKPLTSFKAPRHRCEKVAVKNGVLYVDDSKGTNVAAAVTALRCIPGRKAVILGGQGKGETYEELARVVKEQAFAAIVIGSEAPAICAALEAAGYAPVIRAGGMEEAVARAAEISRAGDTVLLSPACTSWDMYKNYKERGEHFAALVGKLS